MYIVDDPMLALIARFVASEQEGDAHAEAYMQRQVEAIREYVEQFPAAERNTRAVEWVQRHAEQYRQSWQRSHLPRWLRDMRCNDCPLADGGVLHHCDIHERWSELLTRYADDEITSRQYVESTLGLLKAHKQRLKKYATPDP